MERVKIGVVGYCPPSKFDKLKAEKMLIEAYDIIDIIYKQKEKVLVSGLTNIGVMAIAYRLASQRHWKTIGIACKKALYYPLYPVDEKIIIGSDWGDESDKFISSINAIIVIGEGKQSKAETEACRQQGKLVLEYKLALID